MKQEIRKRLPYFIAEALSFWGIPPLMHLLLPDALQDFRSVLLIFFLAVPAAVILASFAEGIFRGFHWIGPVGTAALFVPTVLVNLSFVLYLAVYTALAALFLLLGAAVRRLMHRQKEQPPSAGR